jgi:hypothetical protein
MPSRFCLAIFVFLVTLTSTSAQNKPVKVAILSADGEPSQTIARMVGAKIGSTLRYSVTGIVEAKLELNIVCIKLAADNYACTSPTMYYPNEVVIVGQHLTFTIVQGPKDYVTEQIFDDFVAETSDEKLAEHATSLAYQILKEWKEGYDAGVEAEKAKCAPKVPK